jgi:SAM-dependent methyltransferase
MDDSGRIPDGPFDPCASPEAAAYVRALGRGEGDFETRIHPRDEMYRFELAAPHRTADIAAIRYFAVGNSVARTVRELADWRFGGASRVGSLFDFASGYGRSTRFLLRSLDAARITVAEIDPDAVRFQAETFGVNGIVSAHDPGALPPSGPFDIVLAVSLFSHLPAGRFEAWLERLWDLVAPRGVLAFSTNGERVLPSSVRMSSSGFAYAPRSETTRLSGDEYGTTWVRPDFVRRAAAAAAPEAGLAFRADGLCGAQDLYVLARDPAAGSLTLTRDPMGALEWAAVKDGFVTARGWAQGDADERPPDVKLYVGSVLAEHSPGEGAPGSRREWRFVFPTAGIPSDRVIRIEAESARGRSQLLVTETLGPYVSGA